MKYYRVEIGALDWLSAVSPRDGPRPSRAVASPMFRAWLILGEDKAGQDTICILDDLGNKNYICNAIPHFINSNYWAVTELTKEEVFLEIL